MSHRQISWIKLERKAGVCCCLCTDCIYCSRREWKFVPRETLSLNFSLKPVLKTKEVYPCRTKKMISTTKSELLAFKYHQKFGWGHYFKTNFVIQTVPQNQKHGKKRKQNLQDDDSNCRKPNTQYETYRIEASGASAKESLITEKETGILQQRSY